MRNSIDIYSYSFLSLLRIVGGRVCLWSYYYIDNEVSYKRFVLLLRAFLVCIILLIVFSNLFMALVGWDGLGLTSFLLVVFYKNRKCLGSGMITALSNRIGDCILFCCLGFILLQNRSLILYLIVIMRMTKRAQFPFSSWLPAAMAAPTPVRALVHSSTLVTAGVYVLIRYRFSDTGVIIILGSTTMLLAGSVACVESDLKKVVALSTLSQLGIMIISLGASQKTYCFFHLISHAWFKALLFLCVGVCIHSNFGTQDFRSFNQLNASLTPSVFTTVSCLSLIGFAFTSGFYRKDIILEVLYKDQSRTWTVTSYLLGVGLTSCYSIKFVMSSITINAFSEPNSKSIGGSGWAVKSTIFLLAFFRLQFGSMVEAYRNVLRVVLSSFDKFIPMVLVRAGSLSGYFLSRFNRPLLRRIITLLPNSQSVSTLSVYTGEQQKVVDKGWIESCSISVSAFSNTMTLHYTPAFSVGLGVLFIQTFYYGQYPQRQSDDCIVRWRWRFDQQRL